MRDPHETATLVDPFTDKAVEIDLGLVPIIKWLWDNGVQTRFCCQGDPNTCWQVTDTVTVAKPEPAYIFFATVAGAEWFTSQAKPHVISHPWRWRIEITPFDPRGGATVRFPDDHVRILVEGLDLLEVQAS